MARKPRSGVPVVILDPATGLPAASGGSTGLTDTQLRATPVPVSVTGNITLGSAVEITNDVGNPIPVSASALPLPTGAATAAKQDTQITAEQAIQAAVGAVGDAAWTTGNGTVISVLKGIYSRAAAIVTALAGGLPAALGAGGGLKVDGSGTALPVSGTVTANAGTGTLAVSAASLPLPSGAATAAKQPALGTAGSASTDVVTVQGIASGTAQPISAASLPLPSGAATAAKQPALGTAGSAATDVITVQGIASGTAQPVSAAALPLPSGASTAAKQPALGTAGTASSDVVTIQGIASMTPLKTDTSGGVQGFTVNSTDTITRPADTNAYTAKDAVSSSTSAPAILTFANCARASGGSGYITSARVVTNQAACVSAFRLHLYAATLSAVNDNAAQTVLETNWGSSIGYIDFPAMASDGSDTASSQSTDKPLPFVAAGTSLFGMLETITGFTPASAQHFQVKLGIEQN